MLHQVAAQLLNQQKLRLHGLLTKFYGKEKRQPKGVIFKKGK